MNMKMLMTASTNAMAWTFVLGRDPNQRPACMSMACHAVSKSLRIRKESKDSKKVSVCKMRRWQDHNSWGRCFSSTRVTSKEMPRNSQKNLPIYGIPTFEVKFINAKTSPQIPIEPFAFFRETRRVSARANVAKVSSILPMTSFPLWVKIKVAGFTWIMMDGWWWINGRNARHPWEISWLEPEKSHKITQIEKEHHLNPNLRFWGSKNVNFPDFQPQVLRRTSPSTLFRSPRVDHHEATWINRWWVQ